MRPTAVAVLAGALVIAACAPTADRPPQPQPVVNQALDVRIPDLPPDLQVVVNQGQRLELRPAGEGAAGRIWFSTGPQEHAVNLVAAVNQHQAEIEAHPDGEYLGAQELLGDFGTAFYSRGRFTDEGARLEETLVFVIHPSGDRLLSLHSRYPAGGDSAERVEQLIELAAALAW